MTALGVVEAVRRMGVDRSVTAWEMATYGATLTYLRRHAGEVVASEFMEGVPSGTHLDGVRCEDVRATSFADASLDLVTSTQVFEHVEDDLTGYRECFRILRRGGMLVFTVPLYDQPVSERIATVSDGKITPLRGALEFHGSRITGPNSVPTFWHFSRHDIVERVQSAGFEAALHDIALARDVEAQPVIVARKPA